MRSIFKARQQDATLLAEIARLSFIASHQGRIPDKVLEEYVGKNFTVDCISDELNDPGNIYHIIIERDQPAGYSKIIFDTEHPDIPYKQITKLQRIYLLKEFYGSGAGSALLELNLKLSNEKNQLGMWLYVWKENHRAIKFYLDRHFEIFGNYDFKLTATHSNPNYLMFLKF